MIFIIIIIELIFVGIYYKSICEIIKALIILLATMLPNNKGK